MNTVTKIFFSLAFICMIIFMGCHINHIWWTMNYAPGLLGLEFVRVDVFERPEMQEHDYIPLAWVTMVMLSLFIAVLVGTLIIMF